MSWHIFPTILDALTACDEWYLTYPEAPDHEVKIHRNSIDDDYYSDLEVA